MLTLVATLVTWTRGTTRTLRASTERASSEDLLVRESGEDFRAVVCAETRAVHREIAALRAVEDVRHDFVAQVGVELRVPRRAHGGMNGLVVPALVVDRVDAEELDLAGVHFVRQRAGEAEV